MSKPDSKSIESILDSAITQGTIAINRGQHQGFDPHAELEAIKAQATADLNRLLEEARQQAVEEYQEAARKLIEDTERLELKKDRHE